MDRFRLLVISCLGLSAGASLVIACTTPAPVSNGITTKSGSGNYAVLGQTGTLHNDATGPYTRFDDYKKDFLGGYVAKVDVHIDPASWGVNNGFDYSVAAQQQDGTFLRDFIFHLTSDGTTVHVGASNNSGDQDGPESPAQIDSGTHSTISTSGWYTLEQVFHQGSDGALAVDLVVLDAAGTTVFLSSHQLSEVEQLCTLVGIVNQGRLVRQDDLDTLRALTGRSIVRTPPTWTCRRRG